MVVTMGFCLVSLILTTVVWSVTFGNSAMLVAGSPLRAPLGLIIRSYTRNLWSRR